MKQGTTKDPQVLKIGKHKINRGERKRLHLEFGALYDNNRLPIPVEVIRGKERGPVLFISAAIHGDEINGVEIAQLILRKKVLSKLKGTLIVIPIVNIYGFNHKSRYLPDHRDLNRSFPGNSKGSLASRLAYLIIKEIVSKCTHGIDLHTGANHRTNLPQIRAYLNDKETEDLARSFGVPVVVNSKLRDGSLRETARKKNVKILLYEGGQAFRFEDKVVRAGVHGCLSVMEKIGMLPPTKLSTRAKSVYVADSSYWSRAPISGSFRATKKIGDLIKAGEVLAIVRDPFGNELGKVESEADGILIGQTLLPLVNMGDALFHIAMFDCHQTVRQAITKHEELNY